MREIRMKTLSAGPEGYKHPNKTYTVPKEEAKALVKGGHAEFTTLDPEETADARPIPQRGRPPKGGKE